MRHHALVQCSARGSHESFFLERGECFLLDLRLLHPRAVDPRQNGKAELQQFTLRQYVRQQMHLKESVECRTMMLQGGRKYGQRLEAQQLTDETGRPLPAAAIKTAAQQRRRSDTHGRLRG